MKGNIRRTHLLAAPDAATVAFGQDVRKLSLTKGHLPSRPPVSAVESCGTGALPDDCSVGSPISLVELVPEVIGPVAMERSSRKSADNAPVHHLSEAPVCSVYTAPDHSKSIAFELAGQLSIFTEG